MLSEVDIFWGVDFVLLCDIIRAERKKGGTKSNKKKKYNPPPMVCIMLKNRENILKDAMNSKSGKIRKDAERVAAILDGKHEPTAAERFELLSMLQFKPHDSGKIEGATSIDSSCTGCSFCEKMRAAAANNPMHICGKCYDKRQELYKAYTRQRHGLNLVILSTVLFTPEELARVGIFTMVARFNASGDVENETQARNYLRIAKTHPMTKFGFWAKNAAAVDKAVKAEGKPANVKMIYSDPIINGSDNIKAIFKKYDWIDFSFTVYDAEHIAEAIANGANPCNGRKCNDCEWMCYLDNGWEKGTNIAELLRD